MRPSSSMSSRAASAAVPTPDNGAVSSAEVTPYITEVRDQIAQGMNQVVVHRILAADLNTALRELYGAHYQSLVRLAAMLVLDIATAEEVVQDAFMALYGAWSRLRNADKAHSYLSQSVVNRSKSVLRHRAVEGKHAPAAALDTPGADQVVITLLDRSAVVAALGGLPARQREVLVRRYYADFSEADIAQAMGISRGTVKSHTARGMSALRKVLDDAISPSLRHPEWAL